MSKLIENTAVEVIREFNGRDCDGFCSGDLTILHEIYDRAVLKGMKPVKVTHPLNILRRIRNGMRTKYLFTITVVPDSIYGKISIYTLKKIRKEKDNETRITGTSK